MSNLTDFIKYELYPALYERIDIALPEHKFIRYSGGWRSKTYLSGDPHKDRADKTVIKANKPGYILEQGGECISLVDYVIRREHLSDNKEDVFKAVKILADSIGLPIPESQDFNPEAYKRSRERLTIMEEANSFFIDCLDPSQSIKGADKVRSYLSSRGYTPEDIKEMELGFIPSQNSLYKYLKDKGFREDLLGDLGLKKDTRIGEAYILSIPYRSGGSIKGFKFRTIGEDKPKYINSFGLDKMGGFFNLRGIKGDKDLIIVEGDLDSLIATVRGVDNVVSLGGETISKEMVIDSLRMGAKKYTICLDTEPARSEISIKKINRIIEVISVNNVNRVNRIYIATLPDLGGDKTDPDSFIISKGAEAFKEVISKAIPYYEYILNNILNKYRDIREERALDPKEIDNLQDEIVETAFKILDPIDRDKFNKLFLSLPWIAELGIRAESLDITLDRIKYKRDKESQERELNKLLTEAISLRDKGEIDKALEILDNDIKDIKLKDKSTEFTNLLVPVKEDEIRERQAKKPDSLKSGYKIKGEDLLLPAGALTFITAPTSHGKTAFLINLALNIAESYSDKETYLFSYEEDRDSIIFRALNNYLDKDISQNNQNNKRSIESYFKTGSTQYIDKEDKDFFIEAKDLFFRELIDSRRLNINYSNYNSDLLIEAIRYLNKYGKPGAILIDYIQLLNLPQGKYKTYSRQEEIKEICIALKDLAVETGLPIILGAQFNREVNSQLKLHSTRIGEAGDIERIANLIVGFWNNNFKAIATEGEERDIEALGGSVKDTLYCKILKNRDGKVGEDEILNFKGNTGKIENKETWVNSNLLK